MRLLASVTGTRGLPIDILAQIGFVVFVGLAAKNAILIVEFARQLVDEEGAALGGSRRHAARTRLRPILMTSFAFILVALLAVATERSRMRQSFGTAVLRRRSASSPAWVSCLTPVFYTFIRSHGERHDR